MEKVAAAEDAQEWESAIPTFITQVRSTLQEHYNITIPAHCDEFLVRCLRLKDGNIKKATKLIITFQGVTSDVKKWDAVMQPSLFKDFYDRGIVTPLVKRDGLGRRVFILRLGTWNPENTSFDQMVACIWMVGQYVNSKFEDAQRNGFVTIWDFQNFTLQHAWAIKQWKLPYIAGMIHNSVTGRMKALHFINYPRIIGVMYSTAKHFFKEKLKDRILFNGSQESLFTHVDRKILPDFLGGPLKSEEYLDINFMNDFLTYDQYFQDMIEQGFPVK